MQLDTKIPNVVCIIGIVLLVIMAIFHGSGLYYVTEKMLASNADSFLKEILPVLFVHPSMHLLGLAVLGIISLSMKQEAPKVLFLLSVLIIIDAFLAIYLGGVLPAILLLSAAVCFIITGYQKKQMLIKAKK